MKNYRNKLSPQLPSSDVKKGFTVVEVIVAGSVMIILCVGVLSVFSYVVKINRGENIRVQALSILQEEAEYYRSLKFVPIGSSTAINAGTYTNQRSAAERTSADGRIFNVTTVITNLPSGTSDANCKFKEITITATPAVAETGWLANLQTTLTIQRVRAN
jgi:type II secretory pathway pseudopilin PulG